MIVDPTCANSSISPGTGADARRSGKVVETIDEKQGIVCGRVDVDLINQTRRNLPVSVQRRFDAYPDVSA
jgi:hypothetical protein